MSLLYTISLCMLATVSRWTSTTTITRVSAFSFPVRRSVVSTFIQQSQSERSLWGRRSISSSSIVLASVSKSKNKDGDRVVSRMEVNSLVEKDTLDPCVVLMSQIVAKHEKVWKDKGDVIYSLAQGVVYWSPPTQAYEALTQYRDELHLYAPDEGWQELREVLSRKLQESNGLSSEFFLVTSGANQAYMNTVLTVLSQDKKAVFFVPYYFNHVMAVQMVHGNDDAIVLGPIHSNTGYPDLTWLAECIQNEDIAMVTLVNPGNPTGVTLPPDLIEQVATLCHQHNVWLVLDHTYEDFLYDHESELSFPTLDNVIHIFSMSKGYAMAGFRVGYVVLPTQSVYDAMMKVQDTIAICAPKLSQVAAMGALKHKTENDNNWIATKVQSLMPGKQAILKALQPLPQTLGGSGAMYIMAQLPSTIPDDVEFASDLVEHYGVAVIPGSFCGLPGWIRVCYGNLPPETCLLAAQRLSQGIQELCFPTTTKNDKIETDTNIVN